MCMCVYVSACVDVHRPAYVCAIHTRVCVMVCACVGVHESVCAYV